ncbi:hypothetical protein [Halococcus sp. AFM35]|uniref:hypothetical protein n=1 Tax=Halococcus sp. AFM35 TaxID=3421653 RepID=UPI003EBECA42
MSPARRSVAPAPLFRDLAREDMKESQQCKAGTCSKGIALRVRVDGEIRALCPEHAGEVFGVDARAAKNLGGKTWGSA